MPKKPNNSVNRYISRIVTHPKSGTKSVRGWVVRIYRGEERFNQFFSDKVYQGKANALLAAKNLRDEMELKIKRFSRQQIATRIGPRNTSGQRGLRIRVTRITQGKRMYIYQHVEASWSPEPGKVMKKIFSVEKLGLEKAWKEAMACRMKGIASLR